MAKQKMSPKEAAAAAKALEKLFAADYLSKRHIYKENFIRGFFFSIGSVLGATIGVGILAWALSLFNQVPLVGRLTRQVETTINQQK